MARADKFEETVARGAEEVARLVGDTKRYASVEDTVDQSHDWTDGQLVCRTKGHRFTIPLAVKHYTHDRYIYTELGCEGGCEVVQCAELNERGHRYWSTLRYPPGYLSRNGRIAGESRDALNLELIYRVFKPQKSRAKNDREPHKGYEQAVLDATDHTEAAS